MALISKVLQNLQISFFNANDGSPFTLLAFFAIFTIIWYSWMFNISSKTSPPGPRGLPIVGNLPFLQPELCTYFASLSRTYGPVFKLQLGSKIGIVLSSPSLAREVLKDHDVTFANRDAPAVGLAIMYGGRDISWNSNGPEWRMLRKVCVLKMLNNATLESVYELRRHEIRETVRYMYSLVGSPIDIGEQMFLTILNVITNMLWGGTVLGSERASLGAELRKIVSGMFELLGMPNISDFFPGLARFDLQGLVKKVNGLAAKLDKMFDALIDQRLKMAGKGEDKVGDSKKEREDFLQFLLQVKDEADSKTPLTMTHVKALLMDMVVGGTDTTSSLTEFAMAEIINKPEILKRVQQELDDIVGRGNTVEESHIHKLSYLNAVMKETLRLHPTLPLLVPHCPSEICKIGGYTIPKGACVFINVWQIHRDPSIWENPLKFNPERFLNNGKLEYNGNNFNYLPFGSGRRKCVGIAMAERMIMHLLATLLHSFDWKLPEGEKLDLSEKFGIVLKLKTPLLAIPTRRLSDPALYE